MCRVRAAVCRDRARMPLGADATSVSPRAGAARDAARQRPSGRGSTPVRRAARSAATCSPIGPDAWKKTSPTGFSGVPPPGPAIPVTETATSTPSRSRAPFAIAAATSAETAPCSARSSGETPSSSSLMLVVVGDDAAPDDVARARDRGEAAGDEPSRARLGRAEREALLAAELEHELLHRSLVAAEEVLARAARRTPARAHRRVPRRRARRSGRRGSRSRGRRSSPPPRPRRRPRRRGPSRRRTRSRRRTGARGAPA